MEKQTWSEVCGRMRDFNAARGYKTKGTPTHLTAVVVYTADSFTEPYTEKERSYEFTSDNKAFLPNQISNSIFADCLDGKDLGVRLDWYPEWKKEYCYFVEEED